MSRRCTKCDRPFTADDLAPDATGNMEADRDAAGLRGVKFLYYSCPCGTADIFVDILPLPGEGAEQFLRRRGEMETVVRDLHADKPDGAADVVVSAVP